MNLWKRKIKGKQIGILEALIIFVCLVSITNVITLTFGIFYPLVSLFISFVVLFLLLILFRLKKKEEDSHFGLLFFFILLIALFFRATPNLYITGGQDQGSYVSLSKQYETTKSLYIEDELRKGLSDEAKDLYDRSGSATMLGVKELDLDESIFYMPFYPVFPSWMSIFGLIFGSENRIFVISFFGLLSVLATYLFAYEISGRKREVALLSSFLIAINPLHVYFSRIPLTEVVSLTFLLFSFYFLIKFYNDYKEKKECKITLILSLFTATVLFYTRMNGLFFVPVIFIIPIISSLFEKDRRLTKYLKIYSVIWIISLLLSYLYYYVFLPDLFALIIEGRVLRIINLGFLISFLIGIFLLVFAIFKFAKIQNILRKFLVNLYNYFFLFAISVFLGLIFYELYFYIKEIFINNNYTLFSFESLSSFKQLNFIATFLYLSPLGFLLVPTSFYYFSLRKNIKITILISLILIFLVYCWVIIKFTPYHYYFVRYQLSELIPFCTVLISVFLISVFKRKYGKVLLTITLVFSILYFGYFSVIQLREYEGARKETFEELQSFVKPDDLLLVVGNDFNSVQQIVFPIQYYYEINTFIIYRLSYIGNQGIRDLREEYDNIYILTSLPNLESRYFQFEKEIDFKHNYFVHCRRDEDAYFVMESHSPDIPFCEYIIIPNRFYHGTYKMYLYSWEMGE